MSKWTKTAAAALLLGGWALTVHGGESEGGDDGGGDGGGSGGTVSTSGGGGSRHRSRGGHGRRRRLGDDVALRMVLSHRASSTPDARITLRNRGTNDQQDVLVQVFADDAGGDVLWSGSASLAAGRSTTFRTLLAPASDTLTLLATATLSGAVDEFPSDNSVSISLGRGDGSGTGGAGDASLGAALYAANCLSCHGADARGTGRGPWIRGRSAGDISEAIREGEDGMPTFPSLSREDVLRLAAFLRNPEAGGTTPPPPPPPTGGTATYAGGVKALLDSRCVSCHGSRSPGAGLRFDSYATASSNIASGLAAVKAGRMPKGGSLTTAQVQLLQDWITAGTPK